MDGCELLVRVWPQPGHVLVTMAGEIDIATAPQLVYRDTTPGWYFTGRTALLQELTGWLESALPDRRVRVVTGPAGTGKSAVLAWLCALSDPQLRAEVTAARPGALADPAAVPAAGRVSAAIWARDKDADEAAHALAAALTLSVPKDATVADVLAAIEDLEPSERSDLVVVLDALDEAQTPREIAWRLLIPLASDLRVKVVTGTRPGQDDELLAVFGERAMVYRLDAPDWFDQRDLADYAAACLRADFDPALPSGYRMDPGACRQVAAAIADAAGSNFLVAGMAARARADEPVIDVGAPGWRDRQRFPAEVGQAFADYLSRFRENETRARELLRALAYAEGSGLPAGQLGADMASALAAPRRYDTNDLAWLLESAAGYLIESGDEDGQPVYRIFHQALIEHLRPEGKETQRQRTLVKVLMQAVPSGAAGRDRAHAPPYIADALLSQVRPAEGGARDWAAAHPYIRTYLATHAGRAGLIDGLLADAAYLLYADLRHLIPAAARTSSPAGSRRARMLHLTPQALDADPEARTAMFTVTEAVECLGDTYPAAGYPRAPYRAAWAVSTPRAELASITFDPYRPVWVMCAIHTGQQTLLATGHHDIDHGGDHTVRLWDPATGAHLRTLPSPIRETRAMCAVPAGGQTLLAIAGDSAVWLCDPEAGRVVHTLSVAHTRRLCAVPAGQLTLLASLGADRTVRLWNPITGKLVRALPRDTYRVADRFPMRPVQAGQQTLLATTVGHDSTVRLWDPVTGEAVRTLPGADWVEAMCAARVGGRTLLATSDLGPAVQLWDLDTEDVVWTLTGDIGTSVDAVCAVEDGGQTLLAVLGSKQVRLWDPVSGKSRHSLPDEVQQVCPIRVSADFHAGGWRNPAA